MSIYLSVNAYYPLARAYFKPISMKLGILQCHTVQIVTVSIPKIRPDTTKEKKRLLTEKEIHISSEKLYTQSWDCILKTEDVNQAYNTFHSTIQHTL